MHDGDVSTGKQVTEAAFFPSTRHNGDFLIAAGRFAGVDQAMADLGATKVHIRAGVELHTFGLAARNLPVGQCALFGAVRIGPVLRLGPRVIEGLPEGDIIGQCALIEHHQDRVVIRGDFMGLFPFFHVQTPRGFMCSNRIHLLAIAMRAAGVHVGLDHDSAASLLWDGGGFGLQLAMDRTPFAGVSMIWPDERIEITEVAKIVRTREQLVGILEPADYWALIERGADEVRANVAAALDSPDVDQVVVMQTGGKDSRIILAALASLGRVGDVLFRTMPLHEIDVLMASGLVERFSGRYDDRPPSRYIRRDPVAAYDQRRSVYMGLYSLLSDMSDLAEERDSIDLNLIGGCGEVYRFFGYGFPPRRSAKEPTVDNLRAMLGSHGLGREIGSEYIAQLAEAFLPVFERLAGDTLQQKLPEHYRAFRNRLHFGVAAWVRQGARFQPLASPSLLRAARGLPMEIRRKGRVLFDVARHLCPEAAYLPFTSALADLEDAYHRPHSLDGSTLPLAYAPHLVKEAESRAGPRPARRMLTQSFFRQQISANVSRLRRGPLAGLVPENFVNAILAPDQTRQRLATWASKTSALCDILDHAAD